MSGPCLRILGQPEVRCLTLATRAACNRLLYWLPGSSPRHLSPLFGWLGLTWAVVGCSAQADSGIDALLQEDGEVRQQREKYKQQNDALKKLQRQLSMQEAKVAIESGPDPGEQPPQSAQGPPCP